MTALSTSSPFIVATKDLGHSNELFIIDIVDIDSGLKALIDTKLVKICEGNSGTDLAIVKKRLLEFLKTKKGSTTEIGAISEFFLHLYLNDVGFNPQFLYLNLEEGSIKKGFDGYYLFNGDEWVLESKSGSITTAGISHPTKIKEAYDDLVDKLSGKVKNNPWRNAYNHASQMDVGADSNVRANIKKFSDLYSQGKFHRIEEFNIIPGSTLVLDGVWVDADCNKIEIEIKALITKLHFKKIKVLCITKKSLRLFWDYLTAL
nr:hypothetical protein [uncultured Dyadobacter sp.]